MRVVDSRIDNRHHIRRGSEHEIPGIGGTDVGSGEAGRSAIDGLAKVLESPQMRKLRVVRLREGLDNEVGLGVRDTGPLRKRREQSSGAKRLRADAKDAGPSDDLDALGVYASCNLR